MGDEEKYLISLVIPAYQAQDTLSETLDAALAQDFDAYQIVIVDDGSRDNTLSIAQSYASKNRNIKVIHQENRGTGGAYNSGVQNADGAWISICSADDILHPQALSRLWQAHLEHPEMSIIASNGDYLYDETGKKEPVYNLARREDGEIELSEAISACFYSVGALYDKTWYEKIGGYNEGMFAEDYDFWLRIMMCGARAFYVHEVLSAHRKSATQKSANVAKAYQTDILIYRSCLASELLSPELAEVCRRAIEVRKKQLEGCGAKRAPLKRRIIEGLAKMLGRDRLQRIVHTLKGKK